MILAEIACGCNNDMAGGRFLGLGYRVWGVQTVNLASLIA